MNGSTWLQETISLTQTLRAARGSFESLSEHYAGARNAAAADDQLKEEIDTAYTALVAEKKLLGDVQAGGKRRYRKTYRSRR
jgi:hypothetical protein